MSIISQQLTSQLRQNNASQKECNINNEKYKYKEIQRRDSQNENRIHTREKVQRIRRGGMFMDSDDEPQTPLSSLNKCKAEWLDWREDTLENDPPEAIGDEVEWRFIQTLSPNIKVDEDEHGSLYFRRNNYGLLVTKEEMKKCVEYVMQAKTLQEINEAIEVQALYKSSSQESNNTEGQGLCAILALVGTLNPQLNSTQTINSNKGRNEIASVIEEILIPSIQEYNQPHDFRINPRAIEHEVHRDHTNEYLMEIASILRTSTDSYVEQEQWMYATGVAAVVQAMPSEVLYWQSIGDGTWLSLNLWSCMATKVRQQTLSTIQDILKPNTGHIAYHKSHFFNIGDIGSNRFSNILIEIVNAIALMNEQDEYENSHRECHKEIIQAKEIDEDSIVTQKINTQWFMSVSKKRARELSRLFPTQIREELMKSRSTIQINKLTSNVNWSLVNGDGFCGYQAMHAVAMHAEGQKLIDISKYIQTKEHPYKLITFLQRQISKLQDPNMKGALARIHEAMNGIKRKQPISKQAWCPTEVVEYLLPSIQTQSNYWNHTRPPTGSYEWITTYYKPTWLEDEPGIDIVYNGLDHYTIQANSGINPKDIRDGIDNIVNEIVNSSNYNDEWNTFRGQRITRMKKIPTVIDMIDSDEEYKEVMSKRSRRNSRHSPQAQYHGYTVTEPRNNTKIDKAIISELITPSDRTLRENIEVNYVPLYHPLDDAISPSMVPQIPFPKNHFNDPTSRKDLVFAPSGIGGGLGVYTLGNIPKNAVIMEYLDEQKEVIMKRDILEGVRDTTYMYANHKTNTYINASNNVHSYCGLVNEALEDKNFNAIIQETRDSEGKLRVLYKATRNITAREEIGTRYSIDGSYWDNSKTYTAEFMDKVNACYQRRIPYQRDVNNSGTKKIDAVTRRIKMPVLGKLGQLMKRYNSNLDNCSSPKAKSRKECHYIYDTPSDEGELNADYDAHRDQKETNRFEKMQISESEEERSDKGHPINTSYQNCTSIEKHIDGTFTCHSIYKEETEAVEYRKHGSDTNTKEEMQPTQQNDLNVPNRKHKMMGYLLKMKRRKLRQTNNKDADSTKVLEVSQKNKRGKRRIPRSEKNARRRIIGEITQITTPEQQQLNNEAFTEYVPDQQCRHKKVIDNKELNDQNRQSSPKGKKKRAMDAITQVLTQIKNRVQIGLNLKRKKDHYLRLGTSIDYTHQLNYTESITNKKKKYKDPDKPRYLLTDPTVADDNAFMIAGSTLKHSIQGVFAREAIPLRGHRKLFEYTSEQNYGTTQCEKVDQYLAYRSDNRFIVHLGNVVVDATNNINSYCNHVQELLSHQTPFNCKYVRVGNKINVVQISPIAKNEELNIQYSIDGSFWKNRTNGYPEEILKKARTYYNIQEPIKISRNEDTDDMPTYKSTPKTPESKEEFNLMQHSSLFRWTSAISECNLRIATLNMNGALYDLNNGEPQFLLQLMAQCSFNVLGLTDTRTPIDRVDRITKSLKYILPKGTAVVCFPTRRLAKDTTRLTTMGGQMIIIDKQWESHMTHKRSDDSGLSLVVSIGISFQQQSITIIQVMVPPSSSGQYTMWSRIKTYLNEKGINKTPRDYVLDTASKWHINELAKGSRVIIMGDFNRTHKQLTQWQNENNLLRIHEKMDIAQEHPDRKLYTYLRNSTTYSHIDHIYHSTLDPINVTTAGAIDHVHIHEKTDHFPIWIGLNWKGHMKEKIPHQPSANIKNQPDLDLDDKEAIEQFAKELDEYVTSIGQIDESITPEEAARTQAAIYAKSSEIVRGGTKNNFQSTRPRGINHRYKDGFSPSFRILQESLHAYVNLGRALNRLAQKTHTAASRLKEIHRIFPRWKKIYDKYSSQTDEEDHPDNVLFPLELNNVTIKACKRIDIAEKVAKIKARLHGRQRTILRSKLSERCKEMQYNISINKLKKVIQMIIPTERSSLDFAAIGVEKGPSMSDQVADMEANRVMKDWMEIPENLHYISQEFEYNPNKWKTLLNGNYRAPDSNIPDNILSPVIDAFRMKEIGEKTKTDLAAAMHTAFTFDEFNRARKNVTKNKSPGPSGVTNNQMRSWSDGTAKAIFELSSIMWEHHTVPQFWQDRLMTLLPKVAGVNDLQKIRPISLFENIRKLWAGMVSRRIQTIWNRDNLLHANQHGFRWQRGTHTAVLHLLNQLELADSLHPVYLTMWDIRRAFDSVPKWLQRLAWARLGLQTQDLEWFLKLDATGNIYIRTPEFESKRKPTCTADHLQAELPMLNMKNSNCFHPERGVGQGDTPSSLIFIAVFDILLTLLDESGTGQPHAYADDLAHIARTQVDQQRHADLVSAFCVITGLEVATAKVEAIALNHNKKNFTSTLIIRDWWWTPYLVVQSSSDFWTRYLGIYLDSNLCIRHYEQAIKQYKFSCNALIHRTAPSSAKKMVHTLCLRPKIRYIAALSPWTLQQYKKIDQVPYQLFCQIYGLRRGFPLALIYTPITLGGCGDTKLSDEANSMKWKILHSCIHLGGLSKTISNELIERAVHRHREGQRSRGYADSMIEWCMEMGLTLHKHTAMSESFPLRRLNQLLTLQAPESQISIYTDGAYDADREAPLIDKLMSTPTQLRHQYGIGQSGIYIEGTQLNGAINQIAMKLTFREKNRINTTPFLQELIGILVGINVSYHNPNKVRAYTDCRSAMNKVVGMITPGSKSAIHLPYGPILGSIEKEKLGNYQIEWIESHPEKKKKHIKWNENDVGIYKADMMASKSMYEIRKGLPRTTVITGDITEILDAAIPTNTWIWKSNEGVPVYESLRALSSQRAHITYLNRRDTLRNGGNLTAPSRWSKYNMHLATYLNGSRHKCSTRIRGHQCKQQYDWTTHSVNLAKGVIDKQMRLQQSICKLCKMGYVENQVHTSTTCRHTELIYIRKIYKKEIDDILVAFSHLKLPIKDKWIKHIMNYVSRHVWDNTQLTSDIWNGRWNRHMWEDALKDVDEKTKKNIDPKLCKKWLSIITLKLFETQSALSRHRFKLSKRLKDPMFERSKNISPILKKRILEQCEEQESVGSVKKRRMDKQMGAKDILQNTHKRGRNAQENLSYDLHQTKLNSRKKLKHSEDKWSYNGIKTLRQRTSLPDGNKCSSILVKRKRATHFIQEEDGKRYMRKKDKKLKITNIKRVAAKKGYLHRQPQKEMVTSRGNKRPHCTQKDPTKGSVTHSDKGNKKRKITYKMNKSKETRHKNIKISGTSRDRRITYKTGPLGMPIRRGWHHYLRHTTRLRYRVKKKHKLDSIKSPHPKRSRR